MVKSGDKTLTLSGANSYSGATTISGGTLIATHVNALGTALSTTAPACCWTPAASLR
nr:autotransporter-associated beta strand repeat-containing protein [Salmonella enterica]